MSLLRRKPDPELEAQREQLRLRVHGRTGTCWCCGIATRVELDAPEVRRRGLDGAALTFVSCATCAPLQHHRRLDRTVIAHRLGLDPDADVLTEVRVPRFADEPLAAPQRPNDTAWAHVTDRELVGLVAAAKARLDATTTDPCRWCGSTVLADNFGRNDQGMCHLCDDRLNARFAMPDGRRDYAAAVLMGVSGHGAPVGLGRQVGMRWWFELPEGERRGARTPFAWVDRATVAAWCEQQGRPVERVFRIPW